MEIKRLLVGAIFILFVGGTGLCLAANDEDAKTAFGRGVVLAKKGDFGDARGEFEAALDVNPGLTAARVELGRCLEELKDHDAALEQYMIVTRAIPYAVDIYIKMAEIHMAKGDVESAVKVLGEAAALNPATTGLHERLGIIYHDQGKMDNAKSEFEKELKINKRARESKKRLRMLR